MEDSTIVVKHGPVKISVKEIMNELGLDYKATQKLLAEQGLEVKTVTKKVPLEALRQIERSMAVKAKAIEDENHWIVGAFIEVFGKNRVSYRFKENAAGVNFLYVTISNGSKRTEFPFLADMKPLKGAQATLDARDVAQSIAIGMKLFKMHTEKKKGATEKNKK